MSTPRWLEKAQEYAAKGIKEVPGAAIDPNIQRWFQLCGLPDANDDTTPWCAVFVSGILEESGVVGPKTANSQKFKDWGEKVDLNTPEVGAIAIFRGHVAVVSQVKPELMIIGGNQSDGICEQPARYYGEAIAYRWPTEEHEQPVATGSNTDQLIATLVDKIEQLDYHVQELAKQKGTPPWGRRSR